MLFLDEPTNDLDIPALEALEDSLADFPGALVFVSHDREMMDRLCTEVIGLDGKGGADSYADVSQWLSAMERAAAPVKAEKSTNTTASKPSTKAKKLSFKEQQEWDGMEGAILNAEEAHATRQAEVERVSTAGHAILAEACRAMEEAQKKNRTTLCPLARTGRQTQLVTDACCRSILRTVKDAAFSEPRP